MYHFNLTYLKSLALVCWLLSPLFIYADAPDWETIPNPAYNMDITANLYYLDGSVSLNTNDIIGGFVGEECRGISSPLDFLDGAIFLSLGSNQVSGETISFKAYLVDLDSIVDLNETVVFENMLSLGSIEVPFELTINENIPPVFYDITASASSHGSISPEGVISVEAGENQSFSINPDEFYHITEVLVDNISVGAPSDYTFNSVDTAHSIHADFAIDTYTLIYLPGSNGSLSGNTNQTVAHGNSGTAVAAVPDAGYTFASWSDGSTENPRTDLNVTANIEVTANFGQNLYTITASTSGNGTIAPIGEITVAEGSNQNFQISPNTGYHIGELLVNGNSVGTPASYTFENIASNHTIHAVFEINTYTLTYLASEGGSLSGNATQIVEYGGNGSAVLAVADAGYQFESWSDGSNANPRTDSNIIEDLTVTANFISTIGMPDWEPIPNLQYQMNIVAKVEVEEGLFTANANDILGAFYGSECRGIANPTGNVFFLSVASNLASGETMSFKAYLADQDTIVTLNQTVAFANMAEVGTFNDPFIFTIDDNLPPQYYTIAASAGANGNISPAGDVLVEEFTNQMFDISADEFYHIENVTVDGNSVGIVSNYTFTEVESDHSIHASFTIDSYTLSYIAGEHGSINGNANQVVNHGSDGAAVTAIPDAGYTFASWSDGSTQNPRTDLNVTADLSVTANFGQNLYTIQASSEAHGTISPSGDITVAEGTNQTFSITADEGYHIDDVIVDDGSAGAVSSYTFENIQADHSIHASFEINSYTLTYEAGAGGSLQGETVQTVEHGSSGTSVLAVAETDFTFENWSDGNTNNPRTDENVIADINVTANFSATTGEPDWSPVSNLQYNMQVLAKLRIDETNFTINANDIVAAFVGDQCRGLTNPIQGDGTLFLTVGSNQASGETVTFKAYLSESDEVVNLNETVPFQNMGEIGSFDSPFIFTIDDGTTPLYYTITATSGVNGSINPSGEVIIEEGNNQTFEITADAGYQITELLVDGVSVGALASYTFENITSDHTIAATFEITNQTYTLTYVAGEGGSLDGVLIQEVAAGGNGTAVLALANDSYQFDQWSDGSTLNPRMDENVQDDITVTAQFETIPEVPEWTSPANMQFNMSIICKVQLEDESFINGADDLAAGFFNEQCRGVASPLDGLDGILFLTISSNQASGELIDFKAFVSGQNRIVELNETISFVNMGEVGTFDNPFIFTIKPDVATYEITATAGENGIIDPNGIIEVEEGSDQLFNFVSDEGYHVLDVLIDGVSIGNPDNYFFENVLGNHSISVSFAINSYTISASAEPNGSISPTGDITADYGSDQSFTITPNEGYHVEDVLVDGVSVGPLEIYTFENVTEDHTISASFAINTFTITAIAGENGSINPEGLIVVEYGVDQSFSFTPDIGYHIDEVFVDGSSVGSLTNFSFENITADHTISASFAINTYTITATAGENGSINPEGLLVIEYGADQSFSFTPDIGYHIDEVLVDGSSVGSLTNFSFENITANHTVSVSFVINTYTISATSGDHGTIDPVGEIMVDYGFEQSFSISPDAGYHISDVLVDGQSIGDVAAYTFINVTTDHSIHVDFAINTYQLVLIAADDYGIVTGGGTYNYETLVTINAVPNEGYSFVNWTEGSEVVSTEENYSFTITSDRELTANFVCTPAWNLQGNYAYTMQLVAQLIIDGETSIDPNDKVGAFVGEECRGIGSPSVDNNGLIFLSVASNSESGELVKLKIWKSSACSEIVGYPGFIFENQALIGTIDEPYPIQNGVEQNLAFNQGYTWFSANVAPNSMHPDDLFIDLSPCTNDRIIGQSNFALYYNGWVGSLTSIDPKKMYRMKLCQAQSVVLTGGAVPIEAVNLSAGYTWVGFSPQECIPINEATINISPPPSPNDRITGQSSFALYTGTQWVGTITSLCPGEGYVFRMAQASTIQFPESTSDRTTIVSTSDIEFDEAAINHNKAHTMMVVGEIVKDGKVSKNEGDHIFAYIDDQCVGGAAPITQYNNKLFLNIGSNNESGDKVTFKVWLDEYQQMFDVVETLYFETLGEAGDYNNPMQFHLKELVGIDNQFVQQQASVGDPYPNPFSTSTTIPYTLFTKNHVSLRLVNSQGIIVQVSEAGTQSAGDYAFTVQNKNLKPGYYSVLIQFSNRTAFYQEIKPIILQ